MHKARMTKRRLEILKLIGKGHSDYEIAIIMDMSPSNVKKQISRANIFFKTRNRYKSVVCALKQRLISIEDL